MIETVRVSQKGKIQLGTLKRRTGIPNWNTLCRWALCVSLSVDSEPPHEDIPTDSSVEMTWKTFSGGDEDLYLALIKLRALRAGVEDTRESINRYFRLHLHRGLSYLIGNPKLRSVEDLLRLSVDS
jgi:DNA sulfur modification protein DndE